MLPLKIKVALILLWSTGIFGNIATHIAKRDVHILVRAEKKVLNYSKSKPNLWTASNTGSWSAFS